MFRGQYEYSLDDKGRLIIPIKFREELGETIVLSDGSAGQIDVYPKSAFDDVERVVDGIDNPRVAALTKRMIAASLDCDVDKQGRIVIPPVLRRHAQLKGDVVIVGNRDHLEIWDPEAWQAVKDRWVQGFRTQSDDYEALLQLGLRM